MIFNLNITINTHKNSIAPSLYMTKNNFSKKNLLYILFIVSSMHSFQIACASWNTKPSLSSKPSKFKHSLDSGMQVNNGSEKVNTSSNPPTPVPQKDSALKDSSEIFKEIDEILNPFLDNSKETKPNSKNPPTPYPRTKFNTKETPIPYPRQDLNVKESPTPIPCKDLDANNNFEISKEPSIPVPQKDSALKDSSKKVNQRAKPPVPPRPKNVVRDNTSVISKE
ncbi:hypothetical protein NEAUS03_1219 [Nematocida ausubeli]|nr:hypothetical protein NEAUS03_1219 [Nematocida ausubeli]